MHKTMWLLTILLMALSAPALAQSGQPSLTDIARQTRQEQKPTVTITDDDFPSANAGSGTVAHPAEGAQPSSSAPAADKKKDDSNAGPQAKKPDDVAELKKKLASYKQERDVWKQSADQYEQKLAKETSQFRRDVYQEALENDRKNVVLYQARINKIETQIADAESSSSKANGAGTSSNQASSTNGPRP